MCVAGSAPSAKEVPIIEPITLCGPIVRRDFWDSSQAFFRIRSKSQSSSGSMMARPTAWSAVPRSAISRHIYGETCLYSEGSAGHLRFLTTWTLPEVRIHLDGSCGYSYDRNMLSFQKIDYPPWDMYFCHDHRHEFPADRPSVRAFNWQLELDCVALHAEYAANPGAIRGCTDLI